MRLEVFEYEDLPELPRRRRKNEKDTLYHHGIKGQKWGVRRGPPYPIEDKTMVKGTHLNNVSSYLRNPTNRWLYTYNPDDKWDASVYKGPFAVYKLQLGGRRVFEHQYETVKDLKMPTSKERIDEFTNVYNRKKSRSSKELSSMQKIMRRYGVGSKEAQCVDMNKLQTAADYKAAYEVFQHLMEQSWKYDTTKRYCAAMSEKYDAMVDDNNQRIYNHVHDPVIIFKVNEALKEIGDARLVSMNEIKENFVTVRDEMAKKGEQVML